MPSQAEPVSVLIVDSDPVQRRVLADHLRAHASLRFRARACVSAEEARGIADAPIVIADIDSIGGPSEMSRLAEGGRRVIALSEGGSVAAAVAAMRAGAADFIPKPVGQRRLIERLEAALADWSPAPVVAPVQTPVPPPASKTDFAGFVGRSAAMRAVYAQIERIAPSRAPVLITGESGTGKELCAEAIHAAGGAGKPFVAVNCGAIPGELAESELFGHVRGAFTGAVADRPGAAELADGGTLFLDEIAEMPLALQAKLLRFVEDGSFLRVGDGRKRRVDIRILAATNRDPEAEIAAGRFRADLYYRLNVLPLHLPPLRDRPGDIVPLARYFIERSAAEERRPASALDPAAEAYLAVHPWPGNVRQLRNVIRRVAVLGEGGAIGFRELRAALGGEAPAAPPAEAGRPVAPFHEQERRIIEAAIAAHGGNISRAAAALEIDPSTIYRKRQAWKAAS